MSRSWTGLVELLFRDWNLENAQILSSACSLNHSRRLLHCFSPSTVSWQRQPSVVLIGRNSLDAEEDFFVVSVELTLIWTEIAGNIHFGKNSNFQFIGYMEALHWDDCDVRSVSCYLQLDQGFISAHLWRQGGAHGRWIRFEEPWSLLVSFQQPSGHVRRVVLFSVLGKFGWTRDWSYCLRLVRPP